MSDKPAKLTKPQADLLREIAEHPRSSVSHYPPLIKLVALGLIALKPGSFSTYQLTDAGRAHPAPATTSGEAE